MGLSKTKIYYKPRTSFYIPVRYTHDESCSCIVHENEDISQFTLYEIRTQFLTTVARKEPCSTFIEDVNEKNSIRPGTHLQWEDSIATLHRDRTSHMKNLQGMK